MKPLLLLSIIAMEGTNLIKELKIHNISYVFLWEEVSARSDKRLL